MNPNKVYGVGLAAVLEENEKVLQELVKELGEKSEGIICIGSTPTGTITGRIVDAHLPIEPVIIDELTEPYSEIIKNNKPGKGYDQFIPDPINRRKKKR